jgi:hypothetical protein
MPIIKEEKSVKKLTGLFIAMFVMFLSLAPATFAQETPIQVRTTLYAFDQNQKKSLAVLVTASGSYGKTAEEMATGRLRSDRFQFVTVRPSLVKDFNKVYDGELTVVKELMKQTETTGVLVGRISYTFRPNQFQDLLTCDIVFSYKLLDANGKVIESDALLVHGAGFSEIGAIDVAIDHLSQILKEKLGK